MSDVTDADREKAWLVLCALPISIPDYSPETVSRAQDHLAAALAEERAKARAPFLALAEEFAGRAEHHGERMRRCPEDTFMRGFFDGQAAVDDEAARRIRRAAEDS